MTYRNVMKIHSLFIFHVGGACLYSRKFTEKFKDIDSDLITPFFSAIFSFSESVVSRKLEALELGDLRFVFKTKENFIFVILSESTENLLFINSSLDKIIKAFFHGLKQLGWKLEEVIINPDFDKLLEQRDDMTL